MTGERMPFYAWGEVDFSEPVIISFIGPAALFFGTIIILVASRKVAIVASILTALAQFISSRGFLDNRWAFIPLGIVFLVIGAVMCKHEYDDIKNKADTPQTSENEKGTKKEK